MKIVNLLNWKSHFVLFFCIKCLNAELIKLEIHSWGNNSWLASSVKSSEKGQFTKVLFCVRGMCKYWVVVCLFRSVSQSSLRDQTTSSLPALTRLRRSKSCEKISSTLSSSLPSLHRTRSSNRIQVCVCVFILLTLQCLSRITIQYSQTFNSTKHPPSSNFLLFPPFSLYLSTHLPLSLSASPIPTLSLHPLFTCSSCNPHSY